MKRSIIIVAAGLVLVASTASAYNKHRHHAHSKHLQVSHLQTRHDASRRIALTRHHVSHHVRREARYGDSPLGCLPEELRAKVVEIVEACGSHVLRTFTHGAVIAGTSHLSEHAFCRAADLAGNPSCIYAHLHGFKGGYSTDYARMAHVHVSWHPGGWEQGVRFVHGGGGHATPTIAFAGR
jgi:hypothetical protein